MSILSQVSLLKRERKETNHVLEFKKNKSEQPWPVWTSLEAVLWYFQQALQNTASRQGVHPASAWPTECICSEHTRRTLSPRVQMYNLFVEDNKVSI